MRAQPTTSVPTDADMFPPEYDCDACGVHALAAIIAQPYGDGPPRALCAACARDRARLAALVRLLTSCPAPAAATPPMNHAA